MQTLSTGRKQQGPRERVTEMDKDGRRTQMVQRKVYCRRTKQEEQQIIASRASQLEVTVGVDDWVGESTDSAL